MLKKKQLINNFYFFCLFQGGNRTCYASEHSCVDLERKELSLRSRNLTFNNVIHVDEKLTYSVHPQDASKTLLRQEAQITVSNVPLIDYLEGIMANKINGNAQKGRQAIEFIIKQMNEITDKTTTFAAHASASATERLWDRSRASNVFNLFSSDRTSISFSPNHSRCYQHLQQK